MGRIHGMLLYLRLGFALVRSALGGKYGDANLPCHLKKAEIHAK